MSRLADADFALLRAYLLDAAGLVFDASRRAGLAAAVSDRLRATAAPGIPAYLDSLADDPAERQRLLDVVTVQETQFFRNAPQMQALRRRVLPELLRRTSGRERPLTIWSAGCSTGEEAYTLAMLLLQLSPGVAPPVQVLATDVSASALRVAERGRYAGRTLESAPAKVRERWFEPLPGGGLGVAEPVRRLVEFRLHNLVAEAAPFGPGEVDLVVCRNVTIYFDRATTRALVHSFRDVLAEGGYLLLGHSETLWQVSDDFTLVPVGDAFVYRRSHDAGSGAPARRRRPVLRRSAPARSAAPSAQVRRARPVVARRASGPDLPAVGDRVDTVAAAVAQASGDLLATARAHLVDGEYTAAAVAAEAAVRADPLASPAYVVLGRARATMGEDTGAVDALRKAVYLAPNAGDAHFLLAGALSRLGQHGPAAAAYRAAAATVHGVEPAALDELLGGRDADEFADLCDQLARRERNAAGAAAPVVATGSQP